jgi:hypothetical protein
MRQMARGVLLVGWLASLVGCAFGKHLPYHQTVPRVVHGAPIPVALAVEDERPSVLMGGRPDFVGVSRGGFGNPFDVTTTSGQALARDFAASIRAGLEAAGYRVIPVTVANGTRPDQVARIVGRTGADRLLAIKIVAWKSDTLVQTSLDFELRARAFGASGQPLGGAAIVSGHEVLGGNFVDPFGHAETAVPPLYRAKLEQLLNHPGLVRGLTAPVAPAPPPSPPPSDAPPDAEPVVIPAPDT